MKSQENATYSQEECQSPETNLKMTHILELLDKIFKAAIITTFNEVKKCPNKEKIGYLKQKI